MDDVIQELLRQYAGIWLVLSAENEVDRGEFVPKYLTAVAYEQDCTAWLDVRLCHFVSPSAVIPTMTTQINTHFNGDLLLQRADLALVAGNQSTDLLATMHWQALQQPQIDYRVTLRLLNAAGTVLSQRDNFPIGPLLPPTTWSSGDKKPGYMALSLPANLPPGNYTVTVNLYDPATGAIVPHGEEQPPATAPISAPIILAILAVDDTMEYTVSIYHE
jgi:hypothetical protein